MYFTWLHLTLSAQAAPAAAPAAGGGTSVWKSPMESPMESLERSACLSSSLSDSMSALLASSASKSFSIAAQSAQPAHHSVKWHLEKQSVGAPNALASKGLDSTAAHTSFYSSHWIFSCRPRQQTLRLQASDVGWVERTTILCGYKANW